jgi:hypothetical protein
MSIDRIGQAKNAHQLAEALDIPRSVVYRDPKAFVPPVEIMAMQGGNLCEFYFCWH